MATMYTGLGGPAGYGTNVFSTTTKTAGENDDGAVEIDVTSVFGPGGINFYGTSYTDIFLNSNGTISFVNPFTDYESSDLSAESTPMLAPFFADVDITAGGEIYWDVNPISGAITITWLDVAPYEGTGTNSFQVVLTDSGGGDFSVEYIYEDINWSGGGIDDDADVGVTDGGLNDTLFEGSGNAAELLNYETNDFLGGDPLGTVTFEFSDGVLVTLDGEVEGTGGNDTIDASYAGDPEGDVVDGGDGTGTNGNEDLIYAEGGDDFVDAGHENDTVYGGSGDDTIYGGFGNDTIDGDGGADEIYGDTNTAVSSESLDWSSLGASGTDLSAGFSTTTGAIEVNVSFTDDGNNNPDFLVDTGDVMYVGIGEPFDTNSSLDLFAQGDGATSTTTIEFSASTGSLVQDEVQNVQFRINDVDWGAANHRDIVTVEAYDADGNPVTVTLTPGGGQTVLGNTVTSDDTGTETYDLAGSVLVEIAGPVAGIEITYSNDLTNTQAINVTNIHFDTIPLEGGNDSIFGASGHDTIYGEGGDDTINGGNGDDSVFGGDGNDIITDSGGGGSQDTIDGGDGNDSIDGGDADDEIVGGAGNDTLIGGLGVDELIGGDGDDELYLAEGDYSEGNGGDDLFVLTDLGEIGTNGIKLIGGETDETTGDTLVLTPDVSYSDITFTTEDPIGNEYAGSFTLADGTVVEFSEIENIICFTPGTLILTAQGTRAIETLRPGDMVVTRDNGLQPIRWIGQRTIIGRGKFAPISVDASVLDGAQKSILVSPQHRFLFTGYKAELLFGDCEVLVAAKHLVNGIDVREVPQAQVTYIHMIFDAHEIVYADGAATESFHASEMGISAISAESREELFAVFPELRSNPNAHGKTARPCLKRREALLLVERPSTARLAA